MPTPLAIETIDLTKTYGDRAALDRLSVGVARGSRTIVLGPNGAGKSTLLELVATIRTPTSGRVRIEGHDTLEDVREARRTIGLTPQSNALDPCATPTEILDFQALALGMGRRTARLRTRELIALFGLGDHSKKRITHLSGGTRRKVDLAIALVGEPSVIILDEPTTGLDPLARLDFWNELTRLNSNDPNRTLLISTQDLHEAEVLATDIVVLGDGELVAQGTPDALKQRIGDRTLTLALTDPAAAHQLVTRSRAGFRTESRSGTLVRLALPQDSDVLETALHDIGAMAGAIEEIRLSEPSLDDVFVALASH
ncbi:ABC transporter ATP-binding protein [Rhodococcus sp. CH91]|uniref:ABC transporter ATP-binding protein n=1 Tax=Rhodococcus sp. CH91 TaxID=2910256 RepID=UPI001F4AB400|nr:ABC transporter ATP-binding protein [Rhodococcus sp. CH91]